MRKKVMTLTAIITACVMLSGCGAITVRKQAPEFVGNYQTYIWGSGLYGLELDGDGTVLMTDPSGHAGTGTWEEKDDSSYQMVVDYEVQKIAASISYDPANEQLDLKSGSKDMIFYRSGDKTDYSGTYQSSTDDGEEVTFKVSDNGTLEADYETTGNFQGAWSENNGYIDVTFNINGSPYTMVGILTDKGMALINDSGVDVAVRN